MGCGEQHISAPESTERAVITPLGYFDSFDEIAKKDYAFAVYKEENPETGKWWLKIKSKVTAGMNYDPDHASVRTNISKAAVQGKDHILIGFNMEPKDDDPRKVENRLYFDGDLNPARVKMRLVTRNEDGSPKEEQRIDFDWPGEITEQPQLLTPPKSTDSLKVTQLAYLNSYDVIADKDYAYLAYKEEKPDTGKWVLRITAKSTAGGMIDPDHASFKSNIAKAADAGEDNMIFGFNMVPKDDDPRLVENRVYFDGDRNPTHIEMKVVTRKADGSPRDVQTAKIDWPA